MAFLNIKNRAESTLASDITDTATSLTVATGEGAKFPTSNFHITIEDEILLCTTRTDDTFTVERAKEGTTAAAHSSGKAVELRITAKIIQDLMDRGFITLSDVPSSYSGQAGKALKVNAGEDALEFTGLPAVHQYVDRGDPSTADFSLADLTTDGNWHDLDLSAIVPAGAKAVLLGVYILDDVPNNSLYFRKNGNVNIANSLVLTNQVADIYFDASGIVACDENRVIEYRAANTVWTEISIKVRGWFT